MMREIHEMANRGVTDLFQNTPSMQWISDLAGEYMDALDPAAYKDCIDSCKHNFRHDGDNHKYTACLENCKSYYATP